MNKVGRILFSTAVAAVALWGSYAWAQSDTAALKQQIQQLNERIVQLEKKLNDKNAAQAPSRAPLIYDPYATGDSWDPFVEMNAMQRAMDRMFQDSLLRSGTLQGDFFNPRIDVKESARQYTITMDIPGMDKSKIDVKVENHNLIVSGERSSEAKEEKPGKVFRQERSFGQFMRTVPLPEDALTDKVDAQYNNGVLTVNVGRGKAGKPSAQKIPVK